MPHICPRPCSRLATAAVYISVGVVQFVVGIILLRSKYVFLLAGPDFWTAASNIAVGCLLGLSASVWKQSRKRTSAKHSIRRNVLLALLLSALMINITTLTILLLGEGNTLLSIRLESNSKYSDSTFVSEVLAYAYVTSVCCPIVCIVVSIVSMSGSCFQHAARKRAREMKAPLNTIEEERPRPLRWIYSPELLNLSKNKIRDLVLSSSSDSSDDEMELPTLQKHTNSSENIQQVFTRMAEGKRESLLNDSATMLREMEFRRKTKHHSFNPDGTYVGPRLSSSRNDSDMSDRLFSEDEAARYDESKYKRSKRIEYEDMNRNVHLPIEVAMKRLKKSKTLGALSKYPYPSEELLNEYLKASSKVTKHYPSQYRKYRGRLQTELEIDGPPMCSTSDAFDDCSKNAAVVAKKMVRISESEPGNFAISVEGTGKGDRESADKHLIIEENECRQSVIAKGISPASVDYFSPEESEFGEDSTFDLSRSGSWAGEIIPINVKSSTAAKLSNKLIAVPTPVVPSIQQRQVVAPRTSDDSGIGTFAEFGSLSEVPSQIELKEQKSDTSSFRENPKYEDNENTQPCPKVGLQNTKKYDITRMSAMASISEEPVLEIYSSEGKTYSHNDIVRKTNKKHSKKSKSSTHTEAFKVTKQEENNSDRDITPKRRMSSSKFIKRKWSVASSESPADFRDQVVDEDSLIGLSEEELIARQYRTRSIRKVIEQRIKGQVPT